MLTSTEGCDIVEVDEFMESISDRFSKLSRLPSLMEGIVEICEDRDIRDSDRFSIVGMEVAVYCSGKGLGVVVYGATPFTELSFNSMHMFSLH